MAAFPKTLLPGETVLQGWKSVRDGRLWSGVDKAVVTAVHTELGEGTLDSLNLLVSIPASVVAEALGKARLAGTPLNPIQTARYSLMYNAIRQKFFLDLVDIASPQAAPGGGPAAVPQTSTAVTPPASGIKIKLSTVIDQGSDQEVLQHSPSELMDRRRQYTLAYGDVPEERRELSDAQLSAFGRRLEEGSSIYCDFGVWGPHGARLERRLKFMTTTFCDGKWQKVELPGPRDLNTWLQCWDIFRTAGTMWQIAHPATFDKYRDEFVDRVNRYPDCWHLHAQADMLNRSELWITERRRQEEFHAQAPTISLFNTFMPWNSVIRACAVDPVFWEKYVKEPALKLMVSSPGGSGRSGGGGHVDIPPPPGNFGNRLPGGEPSFKKRKGDPKGKGKGGKHGKKTAEASQTRGDGRFTTTRKGVQICFDWNRKKDGCSGGACPAQRAHACEWCLGQHKAIACPTHPGWTATATSF